MDRILTAALAWFARAPQYVQTSPLSFGANNSRWSFGGNRLQIKAETHVLADVQANLEILGKLTLTADSAPKHLKAKQDLLSLLITNEQTRLTVWLFPLDYGKKHHFTSGHAKSGLLDVSNQDAKKGCVSILTNFRLL